MRRPTLSLLAVVFSTACGPQQEEQQQQQQNQSPSLTQEEQKKLNSLAFELNQTRIADALARHAHFAPLCDQNGYPLVGNVGSKSGTETTVAEFCAEQTR